MAHGGKNRRRGVVRWLAFVGISLACVVGVLVAAVIVLALLPARTRPISGENAIAEIRSITLGGFPQAVLLRGNDRRNPVLLYVHGGPGGAQMPIARQYSDKLEQHFVVVHWDQRGAGASCAGVDWASVSLEQIVSDTVELAEKLGQGKKAFLIGHSWGSLVGALAVQRRPDLFAAYVGTGQLVHRDRQEQISYDWVVEQARKAGNALALKELATIHPPYTTEGAFKLQRHWLGVYHGDEYAWRRVKEFTLATYFGREYTLSMRLHYQECFDRSLEQLLQDRLRVDLPTRIGRLQVPVFFFVGRHDFNTPTALVEEWASTLKAPRVEIVWFENAGHSLAMEAPEEFQARLIEKLLPLAGS